MAPCIIGAVSALKVCVAPKGVRPFLEDAVVEGGAALASPEDAEGLVWASSTGAADLRALLDLHDNIRWVQLPWAGIEPFLSVLDDNHRFTAGQGVYAAPVAEHALALALAGLRNLKARALARSWVRPNGGPADGLSLLGGKVVIVGAGGIARSLVALLAPFRCALTVVRRRSVPFAGGDGLVRTVTFEARREAFAGADVVFLAAALTPETRGMIGAAELACMPRHAWLVNVARGALVDTGALVDALARGVIGGAALDVTDPEPLPEDHPLWRSERCVITPHVGNTPEMAVPLLKERVRDNVRRYAAREPLLGVVDVAAGY